MSDMIITITIDAGKLKQGVDEAVQKLGTVPKEKKTELKGDASNLQGAIKKVQDDLLKLAAGTFAVTKIWQIVTQTMSQAVAEAYDATQAQRMLRAQIEATGMAAGYSAEELTKISAELQQISNMGDDAIIRNLTIPLTTFRSISGDVFARTQKAILDLNAVFGDPNNPGSLRSMSIQVGKALNDPIRGITALQRSGVSFTASQKEMIHSMVETNRLTEAQVMILDELSRQFGGAAEAAVTSTQQRKNAWADYLEAMGTRTLPVLDAVNFAFAGFYGIMAQNAGEFAENQAEINAEMFADWNRFIAALMLNTRALTDFVLNMGGIISGTLTNMFTIPKNKVIADVKSIIQIIDRLPSALIDSAAMGNIDALRNLTGDVKDNFKGVTDQVTIYRKTVAATFDDAIAGFKNYERDFNAITGSSMAKYNKQLELQSHLSQVIGEMTEDNAERTGSSAERIETAYDSLLEKLRDYYTEADMVGQDAFYKELLKLDAAKAKEQAVIDEALANKEISEKQASDTSLALEGIYNQRKTELMRKAASEWQAEKDKQNESKLKDEAKYYEQVRFMDSDYYEWKKAQIEEEAAALQLSEEQEALLIKQKISALDEEKKAYEALPIEEIISRYQALKAEMSDAKTIGVAQWAAIRDGLMRFRDELMSLGDEPGVAEVIANLNSEIEIAQMNAGKSKNWFFGDILGFDPDDPGDQQKIAAVKATFANITNGVRGLVSGLLTLNQQRKAEELTRIDETAARELWSAEQTLAAKTKVNKAYEAEERKLKNIQKALSITQAIINTAQGVTAALALGPLGIPLAALIGAMGAAEVAIISAQKFADGGLFRGAGGPREDKNIIAISDGEYIVNAAATAKHKPILDAINYGSGGADTVRKIAYAGGGVVSGDNGVVKLIGDILNAVEVLNMNLVRKKLGVVIQNHQDISSSIRNIDEIKPRMERRGYVPPVV